MVVAVNQPQQKDSKLDEIMKAVSIATNIYGVFQRNRQIAADEKLAQAENERRARGDETALASNFVAVPEGTEGGIQLPGKQGLFLPRADVSQQRQFAQQKELLQIRNEQDQYKQALAMSRDERQKEKIVNEGARKLGDKIAASGVSDTLTTLKKIDAAIGGIDGQDDIPGVGGVANVMGLTGASEQLLSDEGKKVRQLVGSLRNQILKMRSGGAVTPQEADRLMEELGTGVFKTDQQLRAGLANVRDTLKSRIGAMEASADDSVLQTYRSRKGAISSDDSVLNPAARPQMSAPSGTAIAAPAQDTKVINGVTYRKVPGGWEEVE